MSSSSGSRETSPEAGSELLPPSKQALLSVGDLFLSLSSMCLFFQSDISDFASVVGQMASGVFLFGRMAQEGAAKWPDRGDFSLFSARIRTRILGPQFTCFFSQRVAHVAQNDSARLVGLSSFRGLPSGSKFIQSHSESVVFWRRVGVGG